MLILRGNIWQPRAWPGYHSRTASIQRSVPTFGSAAFAFGPMEDHTYRPLRDASDFNPTEQASIGAAAISQPHFGGL